VSSLRELGGDLFIKTSPTNHRHVAQLLAAMRASRARAEVRYKKLVDQSPKLDRDQLMLLLNRLERKFDADKGSAVTQPEAVKPK
jgi:hypothetical protein